MNKLLIYGLRDPRTGEIRYVGRTTRGIRRITEHLMPSNLRQVTPKTTWLRSLVAAGLKPETVILMHCLNAAALHEAEAWWCAIGRAALGERFTNATDGGEGVVGYKHSEETRKRCSAASRKAWADPKSIFNAPEFKKQQAARAKAQWADQKIKEKRIASIKATLARPDVKAKHSAANKAAQSRPEVRRRKSEVRKALLSNSEARASLGARIRIACARPEVRARKSAAARSISTETRQRRSVSVKAWYSLPGSREALGKAIRSAITPADKKRRSTSARNSWARPAVREKMINGLKMANADPTVRARRSEATHEWWERQRNDNAR
jgi:hypothetical protein